MHSSKGFFFLIMIPYFTWKAFGIHKTIPVIRKGTDVSGSPVGFLRRTQSPVCESY